MIIEVNPLHPEPRKIRRAVEALRAGKLVAYPTDTTYGMGCDLTRRDAIAALYAMKGMARNHPLAFLCPDLSDIARWAVVENQAYRLLKRLLPGPYTFILPATREVPRSLLSKQRTVGLRVPDHPVVLALTRELGNPILSTTCARPGEEPLLDARDIAAVFPGLDIVLDGGWGGAVPSTIIDLVENVVVREGAGPIDDLF
jgi:tRNA threonylcarbamoyl adenosine modification protein (Sua5/YciO/YrdC/YwlC family)